MKILQVRFRNLNSLRGEWKIDFTRKEFVSDGLFLISGPTGSGKTTILDAICLALYANTPRLKKITASKNEIISRNAKECLAEVIFQAGNETYCSAWWQTCKQRKKDSLDDPHHVIFKIADNETGDVSGENLDKVEKDRALGKNYKDSLSRVEAITKLDFTQFTRAIMLAQGDFDALLRAKHDERADILAKITGNDIYGQISAQSYAMYDRANRRLKGLEQELTLLEPLSAEQENEYRQRLAQIEIETARQDALIAGYSAALVWRQTLSRLAREVERKQLEMAELAVEVDNFAPHMKQLAAAKQALELDGPYQNLLSLRQNVKAALFNLQRDNELHASLQSSVNTLEEKWKRQEEKLSALEKSISESRPLFAKIRELKKEIADALAACEQNESNFKNADAELSLAKKALSDVRKQLQDSGIKLDSVNGWLAENSRDAELASLMGNLDATMRELLNRKKNLATALDELAQSDLARKKVRSSLDRASQVFTESRKSHEKIEEDLERARQSLADILAGQGEDFYQERIAELYRQRSDMTVIKNLDALRKNLLEHQPCPLCGSREHPYAENLPFHADEIEKEIKKITAIQSCIKKRKAELEKIDESRQHCAARLADMENALSREKMDLRETETRYELNKKQTQELINDISGREKELRELMRPFLQPGENACENTDQALKALRERLALWNRASSQKTELERTVSKLATLEKAREEMLSLREEHARKARELWGEASRKYASLADELRQKFGSLDPDAEEKKQENSLRDLKNRKAALEMEKSGQERKLAETWSRMDVYRRQYESLTPELEKRESAFAADLENSSFSSEDEFAAARMDFGEMKKLELAAGSLKDRQKQTELELKKCREDLDAEEKKNLSAESLEKLVFLKEAAENASRELARETGAINNTLDRNREKIMLARAKREELEKQRSDVRRYQNLKDLIGSSDGTKFKEMAQDITFGIMINFANEQLRKMSDRYRLIHDTEKTLVVKIQDNYQGSEIRSTDNLSGGERFLVSLAMALGLSRMASQNVRIDSLFLDEGFGTLDENTLDAAMNTLAGLRQEGKLIGIISHVPALKNSIATHIEVKPGSGGNSAIYGPGCEAL